MHLLQALDGANQHGVRREIIGGERSGREALHLYVTGSFKFGIRPKLPCDGLSNCLVRYSAGATTSDRLYRGNWVQHSHYPGFPCAHRHLNKSGLVVRRRLEI